MPRTRNFRRATLIGAAVGLSAIALALGQSQHATSAEPEAVRIGTYDNRAVAIAYVRSGHGPMDAQMTEYQAAKAGGDKARVKELEAWGEMHQRLLHFQGFGKYPVDDMLAEVPEGLARIAAANDLDAIVWLPSYTGEGVEIVDVTEDLVRLFSDDEQVLKMARQIQGKDFVPFETLVEMDPMN